MDYNTQNLNGTSLSDISQNNYKQQMINNYNDNNNTSYKMTNNDEYVETDYNMEDKNISENFSNKLYNNQKHIKDITKEILNGLSNNNISLNDNESEKKI